MRARSCWRPAKPPSSVHGLPLRPTAARAASCVNKRQRAVGGRIEVTDIARDIEEVALRGQHVHHQFIVAATRSINSASSKFSAAITAPAAIKSAWERLVSIPTVAMPAAVAD